MKSANTVFSLKESFAQQAFPIFVGALLAFVFSILIFFLTEKFKNRRKRLELEDNVYREIRFDINFIDKYKAELDRLVQKIITNDLSVLHVFRFEKFQRTFINKAFVSGFLYKKLSDEEINTVDSMFGLFWTTTNDYLASLLNDFRTGSMNSAQLLPILQLNIDEIVRYRDFLALIQKRFKTK